MTTPDDAADAPAEPPGSEPSTKGERTRQRLLDLAIEQFGRNGYRATSVTEITRQAGLTQAASYAYFANKAELFRAAVDDDAERLVRSVVDAVADTPPLELLPTILIHMAAGLETHPLALRVLSSQEPESMAQLRDLPSLRHLRACIAEHLEVARDRGEIRRDLEPEPVATGLQVLGVALLTSMVQARPPDGAATTQDLSSEVIAGVVEVFDTLLRPPVG